MSQTRCKRKQMENLNNGHSWCYNDVTKQFFLILGQSLITPTLDLYPPRLYCVWILAKKIFLNASIFNSGYKIYAFAFFGLFSLSVCLSVSLFLLVYQLFYVFLGLWVLSIFPFVLFQFKSCSKTPMLNHRDRST